MSEMGGASFGSENPGAESPRWIVAKVLGVATFEVGDPMALGVLMEGNDFAQRHFYQTAVTKVPSGAT